MSSHEATLTAPTEIDDAARIAELENGLHAVKELSYKERLEQGGEFGMNYLQGQSAMSHEDAVAKFDTETAAQAETQAAHAAAAQKAEADVQRRKADESARRKVIHQTAVTERAREAGKNRVVELEAGAEYAEPRMSYKERLEQGGTFGVNRRKEQAKLGHEAAVAQAVAEGHDVTAVAKPAAKEVQQVDQQAAREAAYTKILELKSSDSPLDGPALTKAGLDYNARLKLGYDSVDSLATAATKWQAEKEAKAAADKYHADNAAKAAEWRAEIDAANKRRHVAKQRVESLQDGSAAVKELTYKERLERGGELGVKHVQENAQMSKEDAITQAWNEGLDVSDYAPKLYEVVTNPEAEKRNAEQAEYIRKEWNRLLGVSRDKQGIEADNPGIAPEPAITDEEVTFVNFDPIDGAGRTEDDVRGILGRVRNALSKLKWGATEKALKTLSGGQKAANDSEGAKWKRIALRTTVAVGVGTMLVYAAKEAGLLHGMGHMFDGGHHGGGEVATNLPSPSGGATQSGPDITTNLPSTGAGGGEHLRQTTVHLTKGDTIWGEVKHAMPGKSDAQINEVVQHTLRLNNLSFDDARHLAVGTPIKLPMEEIEKLNAAA